MGDQPLQLGLLFAIRDPPCKALESRIHATLYVGGQSVIVYPWEEALWAGALEGRLAEEGKEDKEDEEGHHYRNHD